MVDGFDHLYLFVLFKEEAVSVFLETVLPKPGVTVQVASATFKSAGGTDQRLS